MLTDIAREASDVKYDGAREERMMTVVHAPKEAKRAALMAWDPVNPAKITFIEMAPGQRLHRSDLIDPERLKHDNGPHGAMAPVE